MKIRAAWSTGTALCLAAALVGAAVLDGYRDVPLGTRALDVCTTDTAHPNSGEMDAVESLIRSRLSIGLKLPHASVPRRSDNCFRILLPATADTGRVSDGVTCPGYMALADSGSTMLQPGRRVTLVCPGWGTPNVTTLVPLLGEYVRTGDGKGL